ncbi:MAG TPA: pyruvate formate lyase family protein [Steroidobacteraceae bacterium]|nr:pyruvate formate lyase family protein [Steroidobacteraceae bacterium]
MTPRIQRLLKSLDAVRDCRFEVSIAKGLLVTRAFRESEGEPQIIRCARAFATVLDEIPIYIEPDDLLLGNLASKPGAVELTSLWSTWPDEELDALCANGFVVAERDRPLIREMNEYWRKRCLTARMTSLYDDKRLWPYAQLGVVLPPFRSREEGWGPGGMIGCGWGIHHEISQIIGVFQFEKVLHRGIDALIAEAEEELENTRLYSAAAVAKVDQLRAILIALAAVRRYAARFAELAESTAVRESNPQRRHELLELARICRTVPARPARTFREAMQSLWFMVLMVLPSGVLSFGRFDQYMQPYYKADLEAGRITREEVLELIEWLRVKDSQIVITSGHTHRSKYGGLAKWHNCVIGGQTRDGKDATTELSYLLLEAARDCPAPHPTLTMRVHANTPDTLLHAALELISTGIGLPALISDESTIAYLLDQGVPLEDARDYAVAGSLGVNIPGQSRTIAWPMFTAPRVLEFAIQGGKDPRTGMQVGPLTKSLEQCATYEEFVESLKTQLAHFIALHGEFNNVTMQAYAERFPQTIETALTEGGLKSPQNILGRTMPYENGSAINPIGMINVADSLAAIKYIVFETRQATAAELTRALNENWAGPLGERLHALALEAPKFGNDAYVDLIAADLYAFWADEVGKHTTVYGGRFIPAAITIGTANFPGGVLTGATPDGRRAGECLAAESLTPASGRDRAGTQAMLRSAAKIDQRRWQSMSLELCLRPEAFATPNDIRNVARTVREYFSSGGKHVQFNVLNVETLRAAQKNPAAFSDLIVRLGGCSAYFTQLSPQVQEELVHRAQVAGVLGSA